ncbi:hypothetical protein ESCO_003873 [Escovopsis weberi]|uniref:Pentatricopeptide repeat-containing protein n=1 Tax=Escovopsis weberi TaxID=150374 RepID=A0A0N0RU87_ESCWE|nr:hypothetical protein ESCO_003873 [Escovopsis weberi]
MLLYRLLFTRSKLDGDYKQTKGLYGMFLEAGLFDKIAVPRKTEYKIRRLLFSKALDAGDEAFARDEMRAIRSLEPDLIKSDVKLQGVLLSHEAFRGRWDAVRAGLVALTDVVDAKSRYFGRLLVEITDMFAKAHTADELENLLRGLADHYRIPMKRRWVQRILDGHASRREIGKMLSWLQFCSDHGLKVDDQFIGGYVANCRKYLSLSEDTVTKLYQTLGRPLPARPILDRALSQEGQASDGGLDSEHWASRADALTYMQSLEAHEEWERLIEAYTKFQQSGLGYSQDILRLAVLGCIRGGGGGAGGEGEKGSKAGNLERASALIVEARDRGHEVAGALTPLLVARLDKGDDPGALIKSALQNGVKVHNSVYNKATQSTLARGDVEGAVQMCRLAARENGGRRLLYSEHNFLNLVVAYMSSAQYYEPLRDVVARFTSEVDWWKGSQRCKMGIKLAMKTAAMRAAVNPAGRRKHEEVLFKLDEALMHVRKCRVVVGERQAVKDALIGLMRGREEKGGVAMSPAEVVPRIAEAV